MRKVLSVRRYKAGYEVRQELVEGEEYECSDFEIKSAYTPSGDYIGDSKTAYRLCNMRGIVPEKAKDSHSVCSIGFSASKQKWFGWSHRALYGFGIGSVVKEGDCCAMSGWTDEWLEEHPEDDTSLPVGFVAKTIEDARTMAVAFAESVS